MSTKEDFCFTKEGRLEHENKYLQERVNNLEGFKKNFFISHARLLQAREKLALYEQQLGLDKLKHRITGLSESVDESEAAEIAANGDLLAFFRESFSASQYQDVVVSVFQSVEGMQLNVALQIETKNGVLDHSLDASSQAENIQLINRHMSQGDKIVHDDYIVFYLSSLRLLARNLPVSEKYSYEQIKEFLNIIAVGANSRIEALHKDEELYALRKNIYRIFHKTRVSFEAMRDNVDNQTVAVSELYLGFEQKLVESLEKMKLAENHMQLIKLLLQDIRSELNLLLTSGLTLDEAFLATIVKLEEAYAPEYSGAD